MASQRYRLSEKQEVAVNNSNIETLELNIIMISKVNINHAIHRMKVDMTRIKTVYCMHHFDLRLIRYKAAK